jgi:Protein of unknown function (DUF982)
MLGQHVRRVNSLEVAYEILMSDDWPLHDWYYTRAAETPINEIEGKVSREEARLAFEAAAGKAKVLAR